MHWIFGDDGPVILVVSDTEWPEMLDRKERGGDPEDMLEDLLDDCIAGF